MSKCEHCGAHDHEEKEENFFNRFSFLTKEKQELGA